MKRRFACVLAFVLVVLLLTGCASSGYSLYPNDSARSDYNQKESGMETPPSEKGGETDEMVIKTAEISAETLRFDEDYEALKKKLSEYGGKIDSSDIGYRSRYDYYYYGGSGEKLRYAKLVLRVPEEKFESFLDEIRALLKVVSFSESRVDVTSEYVDVAARLQTMRTQQEALNEMMKSAKTVDEMLLVQNRLYDVIAEIEAYQARLNVIENRTSESTVTLTINEMVQYSEQEEKSFGQRIGEAFGEGWTGLVEGLESFAIFAVSCLPGLILFLLIAGIVVLIVVLCARSSKKRKMKKAAGKTNPPA